MKKRLLALTAAFALSGLAGSVSFADDPQSGPCDDESTCAVEEAYYCTCPQWTDRRGEEASCHNWDQVGGCWYE
jgi:hypothetical protein